MSSQDSSFDGSSNFEDEFTESDAGDVTTVDRTFELSSDPGQPASEGGDVSVALPPSLTRDPSVNAIALTGSTALDVLDQLLVNNDIGKERAAKLRRKYNELRESLETSRQLENTLLIEAKTLEHQLGKHKRILDKAAAFPEGDNSETGRLRQNLLTHQNELDQTEERIEKLEHEINILEEEQAQVEKEYSRQPKREELEQHIRDLTRQGEDLSSEIEKRSEDIHRLKDDLDKKNFKISSIRQDTDELLHVEELLQGELIEIRNKPSIPKEIDNIKKQQREVQDGMREQTELLEGLKPQILESEDRIASIKTECSDMVRSLKEGQQTLETDEINLDRLNKDISTAKEREATLHEDRATLELHWKHRSSEHRGLFEAISTKNKEKERELKALKKAELQLGIVSQQCEQVRRKKTILENKRAEQGVWLEGIRIKREEILKEVEVLRKSLSQTVGLSNGHATDLDKLHTSEQRMKAEVKRQMGLLHDLSKDVVSMTRSRDQDAKEYYRAMRQQRTIVDDLRTKEGLIDEHKKKISELQVQLKDFATAYEVVKSERNKIHSQIQLLQQIGAELAEKSKVLQNEAEILRTSAASKDRILQKCSLVATAKILERDTQRQEVAKLKQGQAELNYDLEGSREEIHKLTQQINTAEQQLNRLRRHYEQSVQDRNDLGLQLIERNEEVCVFYEKMNVEETHLREANMELSAREEEMRFLRMELSRLQNDILVSRKSLPDKHKLEVDLVNAQIELKSCQSDLQQLEHAVECASDPTRLRLLPGGNPSRIELNEKINKLETQLAEYEQQLLEKELLFEQVSKLTDRANTRVEGQKESTLTVAKKVNTYQTKIKDTTRRMMALVSELSMSQATALSLQQHSRDAEIKVEQAYTRLANGEPPDDESKVHWERMVRDKGRKVNEEIVKRKFLEEEEARTLPGGSVSLAEPRPNAYVPMGEGDLPIPKPYGSHAPFKPSHPGANLRHIRKPESKPIDI